MNEWLTSHRQLKGREVELIFIDDGSTDGSDQVIRSARLQAGRTLLVRLSKNEGSHAAYRAGLTRAKGAWITSLSADLQEPIGLVDSLYSKALEGNDIVIGRRVNRPESLFVRLFSVFYSRLMQRFALAGFPTGGFDIVLFRARIAEELNSQIETDSSVFLQVLSLGFRQALVDYERLERRVGVSKWDLRKKLKLVLDSFVSFTYVPIRLVSLVGIAMSTVGAAWTGYLAIRTLVFHDLLSGWPTLIAVLMVGFGLTNISLGIIAEYLWRTLAAARRRRPFVIAEATEIASTP